ncbi:MAG: restriction endonuclease subunit S [Bacillaceae bacterium]|nr:restriction endonuclease subunit S [Bacillaceae bacterium]
MPRADWESLSSAQFFIPSVEEQKKISNLFDKLDSKIQLQQEKIDLLKEQKKGYMQKIFSQELRFKDEDGKEYPAWENRLVKDILKLNLRERKKTV